MSLRAALLLCLSLASTLGEAAPSPQPFSFALMGDMPYSEDEAGPVAAMLTRIGNQPLAFVVHIGDIKSGYSPCSDELFQQRLELFSTSRHPFIYTPGDNEWTDCRRWICGSYDPVERLNKLREIFYADERSLGRRKLDLTRQSDDARFPAYRENVRWEMQHVLFVTINVPGGNNHLTAEDVDEYRQRSAANRQWLKEAFAMARGSEMLGVAIFFQANPQFERVLSMKQNNGYRNLLVQLAQETMALKKPVLIGHGDTHRLQVNRPLRDPLSGRPIRGLLRVETYGSPFIGWVRITVDPADPRLFGVQPSG